MLCVVTPCSLVGMVHKCLRYCSAVGNKGLHVSTWKNLLLFIPANGSVNVCVKYDSEICSGIIFVAVNKPSPHELFHT
jgi:hypothetical protein